MATQKLVPSATDQTTGWTATNGDTTHYTEIDEGVAAQTDTDYISTTTLDAVDRLQLTDTVANTDTVSAVAVTVRGSLTDTANNAVIEVKLFYTAGGETQVGTTKYISGTDVAGDPWFGDYAGTIGDTTGTDITFDTSGTPLTKAQADSLELHFKFLAVKP